jgi:hypothetical protein
MAASPSDIELNKYWTLLTAAQKESLLAVIKSFIQLTDTKNQELQEPEAVYNKEGGGLPLEILQQLTWEQKQALISLVESFGIEIPGQRISIEQYNKEIDEAMARMDAGESFSWDEVKDIADTKKFKLSVNQLKIVEQEKEKHIKGKSKSYNWPEAKDIIRGKRKL